MGFLFLERLAVETWREQGPACGESVSLGLFSWVLLLVSGLISGLFCTYAEKRSAFGFGRNEPGAFPQDCGVNEFL